MLQSMTSRFLTTKNLIPNSYYRQTIREYHFHFQGLGIWGWGIWFFYGGIGEWGFGWDFFYVVVYGSSGGSFLWVFGLGLSVGLGLRYRLLWFGC